MPFTPKDWQDSPSTTSPITAAALEDLETRVTDYAEAAKTFYSFKEFSNLPFDGATDVATAINSALVSLRDAGGGTLVLPPGVAYVSEPIVLQNLTGIRGQGMRGTSILLANAVNDSVITNYISADGIEANAQFCSVQDLRIEANGSNQTVGHGIYFESNPLTTQATNDENFDPHHLIQNVELFDAKESGFVQVGRSETRLINVFASYCDSYGFLPSFDTYLLGCSSGQAGLAGFYLASSAIRLTNCKSFYSGRLTAASGHGFMCEAGAQVNFAACEAQDNKAHGFHFLGTTRSSTLTACVADSNSTSSAGTYAGFCFDDSNSNRMVGCTAYERRANGATNYQTHALEINAPATGNRIDLTHRAVGSATVSDAITTASDSVAGNNITINNEGGDQTGTYAASYTPNPYDGTTIRMTLTGNITIEAVAAANCHIGSKLRFVFTQDAGAGRTVTWNAAYKVNWTPTTTAAKVNTIDFEYNGTNWIQVASAVNL